jgi:uncharacterized membrane protein
MSRFNATPSRLAWTFVRLSRRVWVRVTLFAVLAVATAASAPLLQGVISQDFAKRIGSEAVRPILNVLATGMLAVTTFSLSVMVSAHRTASQLVTPRAHRLLLADTITQTVLATFLGAFLYAIVSIVLIDAEVFDSRTIAVSFLATLAVIVLVIVAMLRWIEHLAGLGSMLETTRQVEKAVQEALEARVSAPFLGCRPASEAPAGLDHPVTAGRTGYVRNIDVQGLSRSASEAPFDICLAAQPGTFVTADAVVARVSRPGQEDTVRDAFDIADVRTFDQDPRFGLIVLTEIASRALSPGMNDPGTAIDVIGRQVRLLLSWRPPEAEAPGPGATGRVFAAALDPADLVEDAFAAIARDGAGMAEVHVRLGKGLAALAGGTPDPALAGAASRMAVRALEHARAAGHLPEVMARIEGASPAA